MAYVGTPSFLGNNLDTLASILQGEAGGEGPQGMQAVANVIQNRANQNFSGYGNSLLDQALARQQFQGQSSNISPEARAIAGQLNNGGLTDLTHGALYYANPGASSASWARNLNAGNALQIGNHYFTDNTSGSPFAAANPYAGMADGPKGQEAYPPQAPMSPPGGATQSTDTSIPTDIANAASGQPTLSDNLHTLFGRLAQTPNAPAPYLHSFPDARSTGHALLNAMNAPTLSDLLMQNRLVG